MFTSSADVFRTRQAVRDLLEVVHTHRDAVHRLGVTGTERTEIVSITRAGGLIADAETRVYSSILLAAALPDEDFNSFIAATAILLADRLQGGAGLDDLYWNYDAFRDHYRLADAPVRAALMNGFRTALQHGRLNLPDVPEPEVCLTRLESDVLQLLRAERRNDLADLVVSGADAESAGHAWREIGMDKLSLAELAGYRFLYERPASMAPEDPENARLITWE